MTLRRLLPALLILLLFCSSASAGSAVSGLVVGDGGPLAGVRVRVLETGDATRTGGDGRFTLSIPGEGPVTLRFSRDGYKSLTRRLDEAATDVIVSMKPAR